MDSALESLVPSAITYRDPVTLPPPPRPNRRRQQPLPPAPAMLASTAVDSRYGSSFEEGFADGLAEFDPEQVDFRYERTFRLRMRRLVLAVYARVYGYMP